MRHHQDQNQNKYRTYQYHFPMGLYKESMGHSLLCGGSNLRRKAGALDPVPDKMKQNRSQSTEALIIKALRHI
jgi:hypothetical protein